MHKQRNIFLAATFLSLIGYTSFCIYLPAIPDIVSSFHDSTKTIKHSLTLFLLGFSLSQFVWGSLSSKYGRKKTALWGLYLADIATLSTILSPNIELFNIARFFEGFGIGCTAVLWRTLLTDSIPNRATLTKAVSQISILSNILPGIATILGSYLLLFFNWRVIFIFLLILTTLLLFFIHNIHETNRYIQQDFSVQNAYAEYRKSFTHRNFVGYLIPYIVLAGGMVGYNAGASFIFINHLHTSAQSYSYLLLLTTLTYIGGTYISAKLTNRFEQDKIILVGIICSFIPGIIYWMLSLSTPLSLMTVIIPMMIYNLIAGIVTNISNVCAMNELRGVAGAASAVMCASVYGASALATKLLTELNLAKLSSLGIYVTALTIVSLICFYWLILKPKHAKLRNRCAP